MPYLNTLNFMEEIDGESLNFSVKRCGIFTAVLEIDDKRVPNTQGELQNASPKQRKQSVYTPPTIKGVKHLKGQNESAFPEEEEGTNEREEQRDH
ncbi:protein phosphatase 1 regulatory subunit 1C isoform X2 [Pongo pygmaeus]|uniref:protein phosphatase 1 regulatory subunit 1C isoform X2 n=1 Tax=Pongo pygmaeus TaxID=9600 RepID=UPI0023E1C894|nr:protein phosphatase 1 regulatory subunit 1C isoform X2 [Pongo pygmaeus]